MQKNEQKYLLLVFTKNVIINIGENMNPELKDVLIKNINDFDNIYNMGYYLKKYKQPESNFNFLDFMDLKTYLMQQYHNSKGLSSLFDEQNIVQILKSIPRNLSKDEFINEVNKLEQFKLSSETDLNLILHNAFNGQVLDLGGWFKIYSTKITEKSEIEITHRIYVAVDNFCLHKFALALIKCCEVCNVPYEFKINNGDGENQYDNVVIYSNEIDLPKYIYIITKILNKMPSIKVNKSCLIGHQYDNNIVVAPYIDYDLESYSSIVSDKIAYYRDCSEDRNDFLRNVENYLEEILFSTKELCDKIKYNKLSDEENKRTK